MRASGRPELVRDGRHEAGLGLVERPRRAQVAQDATAPPSRHWHARTLAATGIVVPSRWRTPSHGRRSARRCSRTSSNGQRDPHSRPAAGGARRRGTAGRRRVQPRNSSSASPSRPAPASRRAGRRGIVEADHAPPRVDGHDGVGGAVQDRRERRLLAGERRPQLGRAQRDRQLQADAGEVAGVVGLEARPGIGADGQVPDRRRAAAARRPAADGPALGQGDAAPAAGRRPPRRPPARPRTRSGLGGPAAADRLVGSPGKVATSSSRASRRIASQSAAPRRPPMLGPPRPGPRRRARRACRRPRGAGSAGTGRRPRRPRAGRPRRPAGAPPRARGSGPRARPAGRLARPLDGPPSCVDGAGHRLRAAGSTRSRRGRGARAIARRGGARGRAGRRAGSSRASRPRRRRAAAATQAPSGVDASAPARSARTAGSRASRIVLSPTAQRPRRISPARPASSAAARSAGPAVGRPARANPASMKAVP